jgi:uncharacterized short protein YbdD (DUF466 family)
MSKLFFKRIIEAGGLLQQTARLMVGVPDYDTYVSHMHTAHPELPVMTQAEFVKERQEARFGGKGKMSRCC